MNTIGKRINPGRVPLRAALLYFAVVFAAGFVLGPIRILWLIPKVGVRAAELLETPLMIAITVFAARWIVRRFSLPPVLSARFGVGLVGLILMLTAEFGVAVGLRGMSLSETITNRDPISGTVYFISLGLFALMPMLVSRRHGAGTLLERARRAKTETATVHD